MEGAAERPREEPERELVHLDASPLRCPFCHDDVAPEGDDWVACGACLARHHVACWKESGACGTCQATRVLSVAETRPVTPPLDPQPRIEHSVVGDVLIGYLSLGLYPIIMGEHGLRNHLHGHTEQEGRVDARLLALRLGVPALLYALGFGLFLVTMALLGPPPAPGAPGETVFMIGMIGMVQTILLPVFASMHLLRETVARHEAEALPDRSETMVNAWRLRRVTDSIVTLCGLVPFFGVLAFFVAAGRVRGALSLHQAHEEASRPRRRSSGK